MGVIERESLRRLHYKGVCGSDLYVDPHVIARIPPLLGDQCCIVRSLGEPPRRLYVRVNTLKTSVEDYLELASSRGFQLRMDEEIPEALWAPVEGPGRPGKYPGIVVADKRAAESVLLGSDLYAPGVIAARGFNRGDKVSVYSERGRHVGSGIAVLSPEEMVRSKRGLAVRITEPVYRSYRVHDLPGYDEGLIYGQSIPSMYVARLLDPQPGDRILDMTAAPGGKITHAVMLAGGRVEAIAVDRKSKMPVLRRTLERLGLEGIVRLVAADSRYLSKTHPGLEGWATKIIVDPPCTNLGVRPKVYCYRARRDVANAARYQRMFLYEAYRLASPGGLVAYSTCTLTQDENESNVAWAVDTLGFEPVDPPGWARRPRRGSLGLWFSPCDGLPGFYVALLRKPV